MIVDKGRLYIVTGQSDSGCLGLSSRDDGSDLPDVPEAEYVSSVIIANQHAHLFGGVKPDGLTPSLDYWLLKLDHLHRGWFTGSIDTSSRRSRTSGMENSVLNRMSIRSSCIRTINRHRTGLVHPTFVTPVRFLSMITRFFSSVVGVNQSHTCNCSTLVWIVGVLHHLCRFQGKILSDD